MEGEEREKKEMKIRLEERNNYSVRVSCCVVLAARTRHHQVAGKRKNEEKSSREKNR